MINVNTSPNVSPMTMCPFAEVSFWTMSPHTIHPWTVGGRGGGEAKLCRERLGRDCVEAGLRDFLRSDAAFYRITNYIASGQERPVWGIQESIFH